MGQVIQPGVAEIEICNPSSSLDIEKSRILADTDRLSELEKFNIANCGRLECIDLICQTAEIAFEARFCGVALVDHAEVHMIGFAGSLADPRQTLREPAIAAVCQLSDNEYPS